MRFTGDSEFRFRSSEFQLCLRFPTTSKIQADLALEGALSGFGVGDAECAGANEVKPGVVVTVREALCWVVEDVVRFVMFVN